MSEVLSQYINGQNVDASGPRQKKLSPWDASLLAEWNSAEEMEVVRAVQAAKKFSMKSESGSTQERIEILQRMKAAIQIGAPEWSKQEAQHQGLPHQFVLNNGFLHTMDLIDLNIKALREAHSANEFLSPTGVVAAITSWNLSFRLAMESIIPALAAGDSIIVKVSSRSPCTVKILSDLAQSSNIPPGALHVLVGDGSKVGSFLAAHPGVRAVSFVGQSKTAEKIINVSAYQFKKMRIRGSNKNSAIVIAGWKEEQIPQIMESFLIGQGQLGWGMSRLLTTEADAPLLLEHVKSYLAHQRLSHSPEDNRFLTPVWRGQTEEFLKKAKYEHAKVFAQNQSHFLVDLPNCSDLQQEELFVPVFPVVTVKYQHELAKWANNTSYGSLAVIWGDQERAKKLSEKLEYGTIWLNHWMRRQDESPWGLKASSFGMANGLATGPFFSDKKLTV